MLEWTEKIPLKVDIIKVIDPDILCLCKTQLKSDNVISIDP